MRSHISPPANWDVQLIAEPRTEELSQAEEGLIDEIFATYGRMNRWDLVHLSHRFPEWRNPEGSALPISYGDILRAAGREEDRRGGRGCRGKLEYPVAESLLQAA